MGTDLQRPPGKIAKCWYSLLALGVFGYSVFAATRSFLPTNQEREIASVRDVFIYRAFLDTETRAHGVPKNHAEPQDWYSLGDQISR